MSWVGLGWVWVSSIGFRLKTGTNKIKKSVILNELEIIGLGWAGLVGSYFSYEFFLIFICHLVSHVAKLLGVIFITLNSPLISRKYSSSTN